LVGEWALEGNVLGTLGLVDPSFTTGFRIHEPVGILEVALAPLLRAFETTQRIVTPPAYPSVNRDMALLADETIKHDMIMQTIREAAPAELENIVLFDIYTGKGVDPGKKSMAYSLTYRSGTRTLTDEEANAYHSEVKEALKKRLSVEVRES
jgi:phenylalanyl-tRNA synthetase beta chain